MADKKATRQGYGAGLAELAREHGDIFALDADLCGSIGTKEFAAENPERHADVGIAEQNMMGVAAGLARTGWVPFAHSFAVFAAGRAFEIIRNAICYANLNVKIIGSHSGITAAPDGGSHQAIEDIAIMRVLPNMSVLSPCDYNQAKAMVKLMYEHRGPVYMRTSREATENFTPEDQVLEFGKAQQLRDGTDACIVSTGIMTAFAVHASEQLESEGIKVRVLNIHTIKPLDEAGILEAARSCGGRVLVLEEASSIGGLGDAVGRLLAGTDGVRFDEISVGDRFGQSADAATLLEKYGLTTENVIDHVKELVCLK